MRWCSGASLWRSRRWGGSGIGTVECLRSPRSLERQLIRRKRATYCDCGSAQRQSPAFELQFTYEICAHPVLKRRDLDVMVDAAALNGIASRVREERCEGLRTLSGRRG